MFMGWWLAKLYRTFVCDVLFLCVVVCFILFSLSIFRFKGSTVVCEPIRFVVFRVPYECVLSEMVKTKKKLSFKLYNIWHCHCTICMLSHFTGKNSVSVCRIHKNHTFVCEISSFIYDQGWSCAKYDRSTDNKTN